MKIQTNRQLKTKTPRTTYYKKVTAKIYKMKNNKKNNK